MSQVTTRTQTSSTSRRAPYSTSQRPVPSYSSRQLPPPVPLIRSHGSTDYHIEHQLRNGVQTEYYVIEDTPEPVAGPSASTSSYASSSRYDSTYYEPAAKKQRKSDGAHISDQPYATSSYRGQAGGPAYENGSSTSGRKRKYPEREVTNGRGDRGELAPSDPVKDHNTRADKDGHYIVTKGDTLGYSNTGHGQYIVDRLLGQGTFGKVVRAHHKITGKAVAVKVIRSISKYREAAKVEIKVLGKITQADPTNVKKCIHSIEHFDWRGHACIVTELLEASVFDFLKGNDYHAFPFSQIQHFAKQLLQSIEFIHGLELIHTDLKPENILLESTRSRVVPYKKQKAVKTKILENSNIRLIDFGSATLESDYHANVVSTRHYRAPEIILGTGWTFSCDVWSIGCILIEFYTGEALFQTHENLEHLAMMERVFGQMPDELARKVKDDDKLAFFKPSTVNSRRNDPRRLHFPNPETSKQSKSFVRAMKSLKELIPNESITHQRFLSLLGDLLKWDPASRITAERALRHPFFQLNIADEGNDFNN